ncbi:MAG TPA: barstar family protein [Rugosimonospora sp.]|nr:barstar family protein [Rugosimonospora sp.]
MVRRLAAAVVGGEQLPGVYRWRSRAHPAALRRDLATAGWALYVLDGRTSTGPEQALDALAAELRFPAWFDRRWEALSECLADLTWLPASGHVLLWERYGVLARADEKAWTRAHMVCADAIAYRRRTGAVPLYVLLRGTGPAGPPLLPR